MQITQNIAIIGAGIAGLSCATALQNAGFKVTVFEQSRAVSGRLSTRVAESWPINQRYLMCSVKYYLSKITSCIYVMHTALALKKRA